MAIAVLTTFLLLVNLVDATRKWNDVSLKPIEKDNKWEDALQKQITFCQADAGSYYYQFGDDTRHCDKKIATINYDNAINKTGWSFAEVKTVGQDVPDYIQAYASGFITGRASRNVIHLSLKNLIEHYCDNAEEYCDKIYNFFIENYKWMIEQIERNKDDSYWGQVNMTLNELYGVIDGYENKMFGYVRRAPEDIVGHPIYLTQMFGDFEDLQKKFERPEDPDTVQKSATHCSAIVKLLPDASDLFTSHNSWVTYSAMLRVLRKQTYQTKNGPIEYTFSSYPGVISSCDDFVLTSKRLAIFETTIENFNIDQFKYTTPQSLLYWPRAMAAHRTATTGEEWATTFAKYNGGTYNNQWTIVDYKKFKKGAKQQPKGLLHVLEQMPNVIVHEDKTALLNAQSYWPSYNRPQYPEIQKVSHMPEMIAKFGEWYSHSGAPRAKIFKRDHSKITDMASLIKLMRYNDYLHDPFARCDGCDPPYSGNGAIASRSDLSAKNGTYPIKDTGFMDEGAIDAKFVNSELLPTLQFVAIAGPTHGQVPVFDWNNDPYDGKVLHYGQPQRWEFTPILTTWGKKKMYQDY